MRTATEIRTPIDGDDGTYLFDASTIIELLYEGDEIAHLFGEATTDLATYEVTNVVFTASAKRRRTWRRTK